MVYKYMINHVTCQREWLHACGAIDLEQAHIYIQCETAASFIPHKYRHSHVTYMGDILWASIGSRAAVDQWVKGFKPNRPIPFDRPRGPANFRYLYLGL